MAADRIAQQVASAGNIPGIAYAVANANGVRHGSGVGYADLATGRPCTIDDQFPWFSMTKIATATTAMRLHEDGVVDLDAPIDTYLSGEPDLRAVIARGAGVPNLRQLLTHTAGLGNPVPVRWVRPAEERADDEEVTRLLIKYAKAKKAPGGRASYTNIGYLVVGRVLEGATRTRVEQLITERVLAPKGMRDTGFTYDDRRPRAVGYVRAPRVAVSALRAVLPDGIVGDRVGRHSALRSFLVTGPAYGGLVGTVTDAAKLAVAHLPHPDGQHAEAATATGALLSRESVTAMRNIVHRGKPFDHGIGWFRKPADADRAPAFVEHYGTGGGFWNAMRLYPELGIALVAMANTTSAWKVDELFSGLIDIDWT